jgi:hypothetical protein
MQGSDTARRTRSRLGKTDSAAAGIYLDCPRCGLTIKPRADWLTIEHCPRCLARRHVVVSMFASTRPADELYAHDLLSTLDSANVAGPPPSDAGNDAAVDDLLQHRRRKFRVAPEDQPAA